jgi:hypothetical protein
VSFGVWQIAFQRNPGVIKDVLRGEAAGFPVTATADGSSLKASWPRVADTDLYRVRLYGADGRMAFERETTDTSVAVPVGSVAITRDTGMFWQVQALDRLRTPITRSDLTRAVIPQP